MKFTRIAAVGLVAASLSIAGLTGCGGSDSAATTTSSATTASDGANAEPRMTVAEYRTTANGICKAAQAEIDSLGTPQATTASVKSFLEKVLVAGRGQVDGLSGLYPPQAFAANHELLVQTGKDGIAYIEGLVGDLGSGSSVQQVITKMGGAKYKAIAAKEDRAAISMGLQECAKD